MRFTVKSCVAVVSVAVCCLVQAATETVDGVTWNYSLDYVDDGYYATVNQGLDQATVGALVVPETLGGRPVRRLGYEAFSGCSKVTSVTLPAGLRSIDSYAFSGCSSLESVTIPDGVTDIEYATFHSCYSLASVKLPSGVLSLGNYAFEYCQTLKTIDLPVGLKTIGSCAFYGSGLEQVSIPATVESIGEAAFCSLPSPLVIPAGVKELGASVARSLVFLGDRPNGTWWQSDSLVSYPKAYAANYQKVVPNGNFAGYVQTGAPQARIVSSAFRASDPTILDVVYRVTGGSSKVDVRLLAFEGGERSFATVVRPRTFVEGTGSHLGDGVAANVDHTVSWKVSADYTNSLAVLQPEILVKDGALLQLELVDIPAVGTNRAMTVSRNAHSPQAFFDALLWCWADGDADLELANGALASKTYGELARGSEIYYWYSRYDEWGNWTGEGRSDPAPYVFAKMGYRDLSGSGLLDFVNDVTRLNLQPNEDSTPSVIRRYAVKVNP